MKMRQIAAMALMAFGALCTWAAADAGSGSADPLNVKNVKFLQRYPWNGKVDIACDVEGQDLVKLGISVLTNGVVMGEAKSIEGDLELMLGADPVETNGVRFVWDAAKDLPTGFKSDKVKVKVSAEYVVSDYQVKYLEMGTNKELVPTKVVRGAHVSSTVTEQAETVEYFTLTNENTQNLEIARESAANVITFYYQRTMTSYTVRYLNKSDNTELATTKTVNNVAAGTTVTPRAEDVEDFMVEGASTQELLVKSDASQNVVTFYYVPSTSSYTVQYINRDTGKSLVADDVVTGCKIGSTVTVYPKEIEGFKAMQRSYTKVISADPGENNMIFIYYEYQEPL